MFHLNSSLYEVNIGKERSKSDIKTQALIMLVATTL